MKQTDEKGNPITFWGGLEEPKQEILEEAYLNKLIDEANKEFTLDRKLAKEVAIKFSKWQMERSYSEEELLEILASYADWSINGNCTYYEWFEQFKKK